MRPEQIIAFQETQLELLRRERAAALEALDLAASLGSFSASLSRQTDVMPILREICLRSRRMIDLATTAIYLTDDETGDFRLTLCDNPDREQALESSVAALIRDRSFAYALQTNGPCFFLSPEKGHILLHVISTSKRVRGMLVGELRQDKDDILDTTRKLFSVVMLSAAHALESQEVNRLFHEDNRRLEKKVQMRTQALTEANDQLRIVLNSLQAGVLLINARTGLVEDANPAALAILRAERDDVVGSPCMGTICFAQDEYCPFSSSYTLSVNGERCLTARDGTVVPILESVKDIYLHGSKYYLKNFIDVSEQKALQQLREDVENITRHDLKTPLNGIINLPDVVMGLGPVNEQQREMLQFIKDSGYKMLKLVNMSLHLYRMERGTYAYQPQPTDLLPVIRTVLRDLRGTLEARRLRANITVQGLPAGENANLILQGEETLLHSLLGNLIANAAEASPRDGTIRIDAGRQGAGSKETVHICVHNAGTVPEEVRDNFFGKFVTAGKKGGTGLGTYSAHLIARTMGGDITFTSSEAQGTTVTITLPGEQKALPQSQKMPEAAQPTTIV